MVYVFMHRKENYIIPIDLKYCIRKWIMVWITTYEVLSSNFKGKGSFINQYIRDGFKWL